MGCHFSTHQPSLFLLNSIEQIFLVDIHVGRFVSMKGHLQSSSVMSVFITSFPLTIYNSIYLSTPSEQQKHSTPYQSCPVHGM